MENDMPGGRPSSYEPQFAEQAHKLCELGATDADIASFFGVSERTINRWKHDHEEFCQSLKRGKGVADDLVEQSLFRRATGYSHDAVKMFQAEGKVIEAPYVEHYPPDTTAAIFWLKNRRPAQWRDRIDQTLSGPDGGPVETSLTVNFVRPQSAG
jgi:hypothetical protein